MEGCAKNELLQWKPNRLFEARPLQFERKLGARGLAAMEAQLVPRWLSPASARASRGERTLPSTRGRLHFGAKGSFLESLC